jgi:N-acetylglucosaminyldiphosphoundecaprenol N-acetyl-beta-D-mannosaminyltransferase
MQAASTTLDREHLFGLDFVDASDVHQVIPAIMSLADSPRAGSHDSALPVVVTPNVDHLVKFDRSPDGVARTLAGRAAIVLPDGQPIVWASRLLGSPLAARLPGSTLVSALLSVLIRDGRRVLVVATSDVIAAQIEGECETFRSVTAPLLDEHDDAAMMAFTDRVADSVRAHRAEFVFVTLGNPKQEMIVSAMTERWPVGEPLPVMLAVGQSFDMYFGTVKRAPEWMQRSGLEWFFRFIQEPRRLFRRYFVDDVAFFGIFVREWRGRRAAAEPRAAESRIAA